MKQNYDKQLASLKNNTTTKRELELTSTVLEVEVKVFNVAKVELAGQLSAMSSKFQTLVDEEKCKVKALMI